MSYEKLAFQITFGLRRVLFIGTNTILGVQNDPLQYLNDRARERIIKE